MKAREDVEDERERAMAGTWLINRGGRTADGRAGGEGDRRAGAFDATPRGPRNLKGL